MSDVRVVIKDLLPHQRYIMDNSGRFNVVCGGRRGEMSKDEIVGVLSGVIMDGRVDVRSKLSAIELLGKYGDYYKSVDRDIRVIIESAV